MSCSWLIRGIKTTGKQVLDIFQKLYAKPAIKAQLWASFLICEQRADESVSAFILRLRELFFRWQEGAEGETEEGDDLLLDQLIVGLQTGPIKQELSRQMRRNERMTFADTCKDAWALEQVLQDGKDAILSQRVTVPAPRNTTTANMEQLKDQIQVKLQQGLMGEMRNEIMEQITALSANLMEEGRMHLSTREVLPTPKTLPMDPHTAATRAPELRHRPAYYWDA